MRYQRLFSTLVSVSVLALVLTGCGHSTPESANVGGPIPTYTPTTGAFAGVPTAQLQQNQVAVASCNLDEINGQPAASTPSLSRTSAATFTGWAADLESGSVPANIKLVLQGANDYLVTTTTGMSRQDVADANKAPALVNAGYSVTAGLSAVPVGQYKVVVLFDSGSKHLRCVTDKKVSIR